MRAVCSDEIAFHAIGVRAVGCGESIETYNYSAERITGDNVAGVSATIGSTYRITGSPISDQDAQFAIADRLRAGGIKANGIAKDDVSDSGGVQ